MEMNEDIDFFYENSPNLKHIHIVPEMVPKGISEFQVLPVEPVSQPFQEEKIDYESLPIVNGMVLFLSV